MDTCLGRESLLLRAALVVGPTPNEQLKPSALFALIGLHVAAGSEKQTISVAAAENFTRARVCADVGNDYHFVDGSEIFTMMSPAFHMTGVSSYNSSEQLHGMQPAQRGSGGGAFRFNSGGSGHQQPFAFNGPPAIQHAEGA